MAWDPDRPDRILFEQSVQLHALYSYVQIQVHRPFLTKPGVLQFPSHHICTNAARACSHYLEVGVSRGLGMNLIVIVRCFARVLVDADSIVVSGFRFKHCNSAQHLGFAQNIDPI